MACCMYYHLCMQAFDIHTDITYQTSRPAIQRSVRYAYFSFEAWALVG